MSSGNGAPVNGERAQIIARLEEQGSTLTWLRKAVGEIKEAMARTAGHSDALKDHESRLRAVETQQAVLAHESNRRGWWGGLVAGGGVSVVLLVLREMLTQVGG